MSFYAEIKGLFTNEIISSPQYQVALKIKDLIVSDITTPSINFLFTYTLQEEDYENIEKQEKEEQIIIMSLKLILGFDVEINNRQVIVVMNKLLE
jgi:hypothetical protein